MSEDKSRSDEMSELVRDVFRAETVEIRRGSLRLTGSLLVEPEQALSVLRQRLEGRGLTPMLSGRGEEVHLVLARLRPRVSKPRPQINLLLFLLTILTTLFAGSLWQSQGLKDALLNLHRGVPFSFSLLLILGAHELGHFFVARKMGIEATLPFFIPVPHFIGTFGAVIKIRSPIPNRKALVLMGAAGPLSGMLVAIPLTLLGLKLSQVATMEDIQGGIVLGSSFIFSLFERIVFSHLPEEQGVFLHPMAFAGWLGMFVTGLNLLPIGQLDGGHIAYSILGRAHRRVGMVFLSILVGIGIVFRFYAYALFGILILVVGFKHPPPLDDVTPLSLGQRGVALLAMVVLVLTFVPQPFMVR